MSWGPGRSLPIPGKGWLLLFFGETEEFNKTEHRKILGQHLVPKILMWLQKKHTQCQTTSRILGDWNYVISFNAHTILWNNYYNLHIQMVYWDGERSRQNPELVGGLRFEAAASSILVFTPTFPLKLPSQTKPFQPGKILAVSPRVVTCWSLCLNTRWALIWPLVHWVEK